MAEDEAEVVLSMEAEVTLEKLNSSSLAILMDASVIDKLLVELCEEDAAEVEQAYSRITPTIETTVVKV